MTDFNIGYNAGLDALEQLDKKGVGERDALAGLLSAITHATYAMAPTEEQAEELITWAQYEALYNWTEKEKG